MQYLNSLSSSVPASLQAQNPVAAFFKDHFRLCLAVYDTRRGQKEGQEFEKFLAFYPTSAALPIRTAIVGLAQAFSTFSSSFTPQSHGTLALGTVKFMECDLRRWALLEWEPELWLVMVVNKAWAGPGCSNTSLSTSLKALHTLFVLLHKPLTSLIEQDPAAFFARRVLQPFLDEAGARLHSTTMRDPVALSNPLGMQGGLPFLSLPKLAILRVQCLVNQLLLVASPAGERGVVAAAVCWQGHMLWGSLPLLDLEALSLLACRTLGPAAGITGKTRSKVVLRSKQDQQPMVSATLLSPHQWGTMALPHQPAGTGSNNGSSGILAPKLRQPALSREPSIHAISGHEGGNVLLRGQRQQQQPDVPSAKVWLQGQQRHCHLLPYFDGPLLVLVLLEDNTVLTQDVMPPLAEVLATDCPDLCSQLAQILPAKNIWHHPGFRYSFKDDNLRSIRATPGKKVLTLSQQSLRLMAHVSNKLDHWGGGQPQVSRIQASSAPNLKPSLADPEAAASSASMPSEDQATESCAQHSEVGASSTTYPPHDDAGCSPNGSLAAVCASSGEMAGPVILSCRGFGDGSPWVCARRESGRHMLVAMETVPDTSLAGVTGHVQRLCDTAAPGSFL